MWRACSQGDSHTKRPGEVAGNFEKSPKSYQGPVLWAWLEICLLSYWFFAQYPKKCCKSFCCGAKKCYFNPYRVRPAPRPFCLVVPPPLGLLVEFWPTSSQAQNYIRSLSFILNEREERSESDQSSPSPFLDYGKWEVKITLPCVNKYRDCTLVPSHTIHISQSSKEVGLICLLSDFLFPDVNASSQEKH